MNLDEFVKKTLLDITNGVASAQDDTLLYIAPGLVEGEKVKGAQIVHFEVAVTVSKEASAGIRVLSFGEGKAGAASQEVSRISFDVPVYFQAPTVRNKRLFGKSAAGVAIGISA